MLDLNFIEKNFELVKDGVSKKNIDFDFSKLFELSVLRKSLIREINSLQERRNKLIKTDPFEKKEEIRELRQKIKLKNEKLSIVKRELNDLLLRIPNIPDESVCIGKDERDNKVVYEEKVEEKGFDILPHWQIGEALGILDFKNASKISTSRFVILKGLGAKLERALIEFMMELHTKKHNYIEVFAPYLVNREAMTGTGQLPRFEIEMYKCRDDNLFLIPTSEVSVTNIHKDEIISEENLPIKYVSYSACFRREAGSYGKDTKGLIRNHQFNKVELVKFTKPEQSEEEFKSLVNDALEVIKLLKLPYRIVMVCSGDLSFAAKKTYDLEVWMPGERRWRELSSCSHFGDFQARRINIKMRRKDGRKEFLHTMNGSGIAIGRTFAAILENYQRRDGCIVIPEVLRDYMGVDKIG